MGAGGCCVGDYVPQSVGLSHDEKIANELSAAKSQVEERAKFLEQKVSEHITRSTAGIKALLNQFAAENFDVNVLQGMDDDFTEIEGLVDPAYCDECFWHYSISCLKGVYPMIAFDLNLLEREFDNGLR